MKEFKDVKYKVERKGDPTINHCLLLAGNKSVVAIDVDIEEKHCTIAYTGANGDTPLIGLLKASSDDKKYNPTEIIFPEYRGWSLWTANISRYTVAICLINLDYLNKEDSKKLQLIKEELIGKEVCIYNKKVMTHGKLGTVVKYLKEKSKYKVKFEASWIGYYKREELRTLEEK